MEDSYSYYSIDGGHCRDDIIQENLHCIRLLVSTYHGHLSGSGLLHSGLLFLVPSIFMQISNKYFFAV